MSLKRIWKLEDKLKVLKEVEEGVKMVDVLLSARSKIIFNG